MQKFLKEISEKVSVFCVRTKQTVSFAESCTGGLLSYAVCLKPGASKYFKGSAVVYSNESKNQILKVKKTSLKKYGAVSVSAARQMAEGARKKFDSDIAISITGIAGPSGGSKLKPVGLVYISAASERKISTLKFVFKGPRRSIQLQAVQKAARILCGD